MDDDRDNYDGDGNHAYEVFGFMSQMEEEKGPPTVEVYDADAWGASPVNNGARQLDGFGYTGAYGDEDDGYDSDRGPDLLESAPALFHAQPDPVVSSGIPTPESPPAHPASDDSHLLGGGQEVDAGFGALSSILESVRPVHEGKRVPTTQTPRADSARDDSPPSSPIIPPRSTGRTRAPSLVTRYVHACLALVHIHIADCRGFSLFLFLSL